MKSVTIYTGPLCNYCDAAKRLLARNNNPIRINKIPILFPFCIILSLMI